MIGNKTVLAIVPARGGSKGLPKKNIKTLGNKPLIAHSIIAAQKSRYVDRIIVSTDSDEIARIAKSCNADVPFKRPPEYAVDISPSREFIVHALSWLRENENKVYDIFCLLQPTSPFRNWKHLDEAIEKFVNCKKAISLISITETTESPYWMKTIGDNDFLREFVEVSYSEVRRQDLPKTYSVNGAIFIMGSFDYLKSERFFTERTAYYLMDAISSVDIDGELDFIFAECDKKQAGRS